MNILRPDQRRPRQKTDPTAPKRLLLKRTKRSTINVERPTPKPELLHCATASAFSGYVYSDLVFDNKSADPEEKAAVKK